MREVEDFWEELLAQIEAGQVIPVVGPELLTVVEYGREIPLYHALAERLLVKYSLSAHVAALDGDPVPNDTSVALHPFHELNDAVCALASRGRRVQELYRPINDLLKVLVESPAPSSIQSLRELASVSGFKLFITTTPDDLLARAVDAERHGGMAKTDHIVFAPKLPSGTPSRDLPEDRSSGYTAVCYLLGKASPSPFVFAIHDEDTLEFIHNLQINAADGMKLLYSELCAQNLLLIGCDFSDWLSRFFIRLSNTQRLADNRSKREFLIEQSAKNGSLTAFLERFSPDTWVLPGSAREAVSELARRWSVRHPAAPTGPEESPPLARVEETFFISYSRTDLAAARQLFSELQDIGADVIWFDKSELKPGDDWEQKIRNAIDSCYLFLPLISANTESREEGFFREEWTLGSERVRRIQGRKFIIPIVIDRDFDGDASRFHLVPVNFPNAQFGHAPEGGMSDTLRSELIRLIRERRAQRPA